MNKLEQLSTAELLAEIKKRKTANVRKFTHELPNSSQREKFAQYSTPPHIAEFMVKLANNCQEGDFKDQIIYEPFVGAGAMFLPLRNKGAVLIGSDIDLEALEICKQLVPEAILIHHDTVGCLEPQSNIRHFQKKIEEIKAQPKKTKPQIAKDTAEIARLEKKIEQEKLRTP
ncbi:13951_t:CDS:2 [Funneliformis geosporum]|nr:13951_t:CDS:2 [Funneliformis geosporum]